MKTAELPPDRNYVIGGHPHGIMSVGIFTNFNTEMNGFSKHFPGIRLTSVGLSFIFYFPIYRDYVSSYGEAPLPHPRQTASHPAS